MKLVLVCIIIRSKMCFARTRTWRNRNCCRNRRRIHRFRQCRMSCSRRMSHRRNLPIRSWSDPSSSTCWRRCDRWGIPKRRGERPCPARPTRRRSCSCWANCRRPSAKGERDEDRAFALRPHRRSLPTPGHRRQNCRPATTPSPRLDSTGPTTSGGKERRTGSNFEMPSCGCWDWVAQSALRLNGKGVYYS